MSDEKKSLDEYCDTEDFHTVYHNNIYCSIGLRNKVKCKYQSDYLDQNGLYPCMNLNFLSAYNKKK